jgi:hypothetical protein
MVEHILEPEGLYYDTELKIIAALKPRPNFLPILRLLNEVVEYKETSGLLVTRHWSNRNRRATASLSPVLTLYLAPDGELYVKLQKLLAQDQTGVIPLPTLLSQQRPRPKKPRHGIPSRAWPSVVRRVMDNQEPLRKVAADYGVSYETIRRTVRAAKK